MFPSGELEGAGDMVGTGGTVGTGVGGDAGQENGLDIAPPQDADCDVEDKSTLGSSARQVVFSENPVMQVPSQVPLPVSEKQEESCDVSE